MSALIPRSARIPASRFRSDSESHDGRLPSARARTPGVGRRERVAGHSRRSSQIRHIVATNHPLTTEALGTKIPAFDQLTNSPIVHLQRVGGLRDPHDIHANNTTASGSI